MTEDQIKHMTDRFLQWKLPKDFSPDAGISFQPDYNVDTDHPMKHEPVGTNLFTADQAEAMVRFMVDQLPSDQLTIEVPWGFVVYVFRHQIFNEIIKHMNLTLEEIFVKWETLYENYDPDVHDVVKRAMDELVDKSFHLYKGP